MADQQAFEKLKDFFETREVCALAAEPLNKNVEIGIIINHNLHCAFFKEDGKPRFEKREAVKPDVIFYMSPDAVEGLVAHHNDDIAELGVNIVKSYLAGSVKIKVEGSMINLLTRGYLGIIKTGGPSFMKYLAGHGVGNLNKLREIFQSLRKK